MTDKIAGKPRIFIGSSTKSYELVKWLAEQIRSYDLAIPIEWKTGGFSPSKSTLQNLIDNCQTCDFAVLFFTRDDDKPAKGNFEYNPLNIFKGPRDNMIFEAGLFVGGLGLDPTRCILVSSVEENALPSDIKGVTYIKIKEPPPPEPPYCRLSEEWCREHLQGVLESVIYSVNSYGEFLYRPYLKILTKRELAEREQVGKGCLEKYDRVVINSSEPEDMSEFDLACAVAENIKNNIYYDFHFKISEDNCENVASQFIDFIRILLATYCIGDKDYSEGDLKNERDIIEFLNLKENEQNVDNAIKDFRRRLSIYIHKYTHLIPFRIAVHNVSSFDRAKCYLRHEDFYVEWFLKEEAREAIDILKTEDDEAEPEKKNRIFQATDTFDLYSNDLSAEDWKELNSNPDIALKKFIYKELDECKLFRSNEERSRFLKKIKLRLRAISSNQRENNLNKQVRKILMKKIIELFPIDLWEKIRDLCFGNDCEYIFEEWEEIPKKSVGTLSDKCVASVMKKFKEIKLSDKLKDALEKINMNQDGDYPVRVYSDDNESWEISYEKLKSITINNQDEELKELIYNDDLLNAVEKLTEWISKQISSLKSNEKIGADQLPQFLESIKSLLEKGCKLKNDFQIIMEKIDFLQKNRGPLLNLIKKIEKEKAYDFIHLYWDFKLQELPLIETEIFNSDWDNVDPYMFDEEKKDEFDKVMESFDDPNNEKLWNKLLPHSSVIEKWLKVLHDLLEHRTDILSAIQALQINYPGDTDIQIEVDMMKQILSYVLIPFNEADGKLDDHKIAYISKLQKMSFANKLFKAMPECKYIMVTDNGKKSGKWLGVINRDDLLFAYGRP